MRVAFTVPLNEMRSTHYSAMSNFRPFRVGIRELWRAIIGCGDRETCRGSGTILNSAGNFSGGSPATERAYAVFHYPAKEQG